MAAAHGLNQRLENAPASPAASLPSLLSEAAEVQRQLDAWRGELDVICARLDEPTDVNPSNYRLLEELLSLPNLTVAHRGKLRTMAATMSTELHQSWLQRVDAAAQTPLGQPRGGTSKPMAETAPPPGTESASQWERLVFWETHPLIAILFWPDEQTAPDA